MLLPTSNVSCGMVSTRGLLGSLALAAMLIQPSNAYFPVEVVSQVVHDVASLFNNDCVLLCAADGHVQPLGERLRELRVRKLLSLLGILTATVGDNDLEDFNQTSRRFQCRQSRALYVATWSGDDRKVFSKFHQIPSHPRWLVFTDEMKPSTLLRGLYVPFDCQLIIATRAGAEVQLTEFYRVSLGAPLRRARFAHWRPLGGLSPPSPNFLYSRRRDLHGLVVKAATLEVPPTTAWVLNSSGDKRLGGFLGEIWASLEKNCNFSMVYTEPKYGEDMYGLVNANGSWTGAVGMIVEKRVELAVVGLTLTKQRMDAVDFLTPLIRSSTNLAIRSPDSKRLEWTNFLTPFSPALWSAILVLVALLGVTLSCVRSVVRRHGNEEAESQDSPGYVVDSLLQVVGLFCQQGQSVPPASTASRIVYLMACLLAVVILASYSGSIVSSLTNQEPVLPFTSLQGLLDHAKFKVVFLEKVVGTILFQNKDKDPFLQKLHARSFPDMPPLERVCAEDLAFIGSGVNFEGSVRMVPCKTLWFTENLLTQYLSIIASKDSHLKRFFNYQLGRLREGGIINRSQKISWPIMTLTQEPEVIDVRQVGLVQVTPALAALSVCILLALILLAGEWCLQKSYSPKFSFPSWFHKNVEKVIRIK